MADRSTCSPRDYRPRELLLTGDFSMYYTLPDIEMQKARGGAFNWWYPFKWMADGIRWLWESVT